MEADGESPGRVPVRGFFLGISNLLISFISHDHLRAPTPTTPLDMSSTTPPSHFKLNNGISIPAVGLGQSQLYPLPCDLQYP